MRCVEDRGVARWRIMVPFHKEFRVSPIIAGENVFRNKFLSWQLGDPPLPRPPAGLSLKDPRRVRKLKAGRRQLIQYLTYCTGNPAAAR